MLSSETATHSFYDFKPVLYVTSPNQDLIHIDHAIKAKKHLSIQFLFFIALNNMS